jgi:hypothetical protein
MRYPVRSIRILTLAVTLSIVTAIPALALYRQLSTGLTGPAINGVTPQGDAKVDQSRLPDVPATLQVRVKNVNLPDGTVLTVNLGGHFAGDGTNVGTVVINRGEGQATISLTNYFAVGRTDPIGILNGGTVILSGGAPWKV